MAPASISRKLSSIRKCLMSCKHSETDGNATKRNSFDPRLPLRDGFLSASQEDLIARLMNTILKGRWDVYDWTPIDRPTATQLQIEVWFQSIPRENLICYLADTICMWRRGEDLSRLRLAERGLSEEDIVMLLSKRGVTMEYVGNVVVIHQMLLTDSSTIISLLDQILSPERLLSVILSKHSHFKLNVLSSAVAYDRLTICEYLMKRLDRDDVSVLLRERGRGGWTSLHWAVDQNNSLGEFFSLLNDKTETRHLLSIKDHEGQTVLSSSVSGSKDTSFQSIIQHYSYDQLEILELAAYADKKGNTIFHYAAGKQTANFLIALLKLSSPQNHPVVSIRDGKGLTVLAYSIYWDRRDAFQAIIRHYAHRSKKLLELAAIVDSEENTSFHYAAGQKTSSYLSALIKSTSSQETSTQLAAILSKRNISGKNNRLGRKVKRPDSDNDLIYDWALDSLTNNRYLLFDLPSVLVMYTTNDREDAEVEAQALIESLQSLGLKVETVKDFTEDQLFDKIESSQILRGKNGQIVALMSHGVSGYIKDNNGKEIRLRQIELAMSLSDSTPKVLILQCCQNYNGPTYTSVSTQTVVETSSAPLKDGRMEAASRKAVRSGFNWLMEAKTTECVDVSPCMELNVEGECPQLCTEEDGGPGSEYEIFYPNVRHFCLLSSCSPSRPSRRNCFIPALAAALAKLKHNEDITGSVRRAMYDVRSSSKNLQTPHVIDCMESTFCIRNILPLYLARKCAENHEAS